MLILPLGLAILTITTPALGRIFWIDQNHLGKEEQCKELLVEHFLTLGRSQFDPEVVRDCISFLRSKDLENDGISPQEFSIIGKRIDNKMFDQIKLASESSGKFEKSEALDSEIKNNSKETEISESKTSETLPKDSESEPTNEVVNLHSENVKNSKGAESTESNPSETLPKEDSQVELPDDDLVDIYPENIIPEWPAVQLVRKRREISENLLQDSNLELSNDVVDPEKLTQESAQMTRRKREVRTAKIISAKTKKDTSPDPRPTPEWEKYSFKDEATLDVRGRNRPNTFWKLIKHYVSLVINRIKTCLGLVPKVKTSGN
ncbi:uncharacterized protein LOC128987001 [Macrosteles quadrilineatus]|uniref:uncharacterized protein LOC128987001 n=1 Tax=Macrosteles quadrilineatus TaxID=74068 RepID=UPI0023E17FFA|nr:uncharacterized protein LOC128987001 [Macrosteles quadrilineatus]